MQRGTRKRAAPGAGCGITEDEGPNGLHLPGSDPKSHHDGSPAQHQASRAALVKHEAAAEQEQPPQFEEGCCDDPPASLNNVSISDLCLPSTSFSLPQFPELQQQGVPRSEGGACWPANQGDGADDGQLHPLPSLPPHRLSDESNASCGNGDLLAADHRGATSKPQPRHAAAAVFGSAAHMDGRRYNPMGGMSELHLPRQQSQPPFNSPSLPLHPFNSLPVEAASHGMHHAGSLHLAPMETGDEHWPSQGTSSMHAAQPWSTPEQTEPGPKSHSTSGGELDDLEQLLQAAVQNYDDDVGTWQQGGGQYMLMDSAQNMPGIPPVPTGDTYMSISSDAPGGSNTLACRTKMGSLGAVSMSSAGLSHASAHAPGLMANSTLPPLVVTNTSPRSPEGDNITPTNMPPAPDHLYLPATYRGMDMSPQHMGMATHPLPTMVNGDGLSGDIMVGTSSTEFGKFSSTGSTRLHQQPSPSLPHPHGHAAGSPASGPALPHPATLLTPPPAIKMSLSSAGPMALRSKAAGGEGDSSLVAKANAAASAVVAAGMSPRCSAPAEGTSGASPSLHTNKASTSASTPPPIVPPASPLVLKPGSGAASITPDTKSAFTVPPAIKLPGPTLGGNSPKRTRLTNAPAAADGLKGSGLAGAKSAAAALLATSKPVDALAVLATQSLPPPIKLPSKPGPPTGPPEAKVLLDILSPTIMPMAPRKPRRGGGRTTQADPRLDPEIDPKKARRIFANRMSAARSKMRQRMLAEHVEQEHQALEQHKAELAGCISTLREQVAGLEAENTTLKQRVAHLEAERAKAIAYAQAQMARGAGPTPPPPAPSAAAVIHAQRPPIASKFSIGASEQATVAVTAVAAGGRWPPQPPPAVQAPPPHGMPPVPPAVQSPFPLKAAADAGTPCMAPLPPAPTPPAAPHLGAQVPGLLGAAAPMPPGSLRSLGSSQGDLEPINEDVFADQPLQPTPPPLHLGRPPAPPAPPGSAGCSAGALGGRHTLKLHSPPLCPLPPHAPLDLQDGGYASPMMAGRAGDAPSMDLRLPGSQQGQQPAWLGSGAPAAAGGVSIMKTACVPPGPGMPRMMQRGPQLLDPHCAPDGPECLSLSPQDMPPMPPGHMQPPGGMRPASWAPHGSQPAAGVRDMSASFLEGVGCLGMNADVLQHLGVPSTGIVALSNKRPPHHQHQQHSSSNSTSIHHVPAHA